MSEPKQDWANRFHSWEPNLNNPVIQLAIAAPFVAASVGAVYASYVPNNDMTPTQQPSNTSHEESAPADATVQSEDEVSFDLTVD